MTQTEHLRLIRARCVELLEIAEKRTAGAWKTDAHYVDRDGETFFKVPGNSGHDATFIASCAGAAEAGWRATVSMIDCALLIIGCLEDCENHPLQSRELEIAQHFAFELISAWPIELLNNK